MPRVERTQDVIEIHWENALVYGVGGVLFLGLFGFLLYYGTEGSFIALTWLMLVFGLACLGYGTRRAIEVRKVTSVAYTCPYCESIVELTEVAQSDFSCSECARVIPVEDGEVMPVHLVRCGYCHELNFYSDKTEFLVCENCSHEIPISSDSHGHKSVPKFYAVVEDDALYELVLVESGTKTEDLIACLQRMLALNRSQVKQMLDQLPVTLLTGISRRKADMLLAQLTIHEGGAEARPLV